MIEKPKEYLKNAIKTNSQYEQSLPKIVSFIDKGCTNECKLVINSIEKMISDKKFSPHQKTLALEIFQACMLLNKTEFIANAQNIILKKFVELAQKNCKDLFKDSEENSENLHYSDEFLNKLLNYFYI